ncbi:ankyrin repeat and protein kinase domain-containing protein 1-like [Fagus crenata]
MASTIDQINPDPEMENVKKDLFKKAMKGEWEKVVEIYRTNPMAHKAKLTRSGDTALQIAVSDGQEKRVEELNGYNYCRKKDGDTILHCAIFGDYFECVTGFLPSQPSSHPSSSPGPSHSPHSFTSSSTPAIPMATPSDLAPILDLTSVNTTTPTPTPESAPTPPSTDIATPEPSCIVIEPPMPDLQVIALTAAPKPDSPPSAASCPIMDPPATEPFVTAPPASPAQPTLTVSSMVTSTPTINLIPPLTVHTEPLSPSVPLSPSTTSNDIVSPIQSGTLYIDLPMDPLPITSIPQPRPTNTYPMLTRGIFVDELENEPSDHQNQNLEVLEIEREASDLNFKEIIIDEHEPKNSLRKN